MKKILLILTAVFAVTFMVNAQAVTVGEGTSNTHASPYFTTWNYSFEETIYSASDINKGMGTITAIRYYLAESYDTETTENIEVYMRNVTQSDFVGANELIPVTFFDRVFNGSWTIPANYTGWISIYLDEPFQYDGTHNILVGIHEKTPGSEERRFNYTHKDWTCKCVYTNVNDFDATNPSTYPNYCFDDSHRANIQFIFGEYYDFEDRQVPGNWSYYGANTDSWYAAGVGSYGNIAACDGEYSLYINGTGKQDYDYLVSPGIVINNYGTLTFKYITPKWGDDQNDLTVGYGLTPEGPWYSFGQFDAMVSDEWTTGTVNLSGLNGYYYIAFLSYDGYGFCTALDDIFIDTQESVLAITEVFLEGFTEPSYGNLLDFDLTVQNGAPYSVDETYWYYSEYDDFVYPSHVCQNDGYYYMIVILSPANEYYFDPNATVYFDGDASICDEQYNEVLSDGRLKIFSVNFYPYEGVDENSVSPISVYPNPSHSILYIEGLEAATEVRFYNALGMLVKTVNATTDKEINVSDLSEGVYVIRCGKQMIRFVKTK